MRYIFGSQLSDLERAAALEHFGNRFTGDHTPDWVTGRLGKECPPLLQFASDDDWLQNTEFEVDEAGKITGLCVTHPTWPGNPEIGEALENGA